MSKEILNNTHNSGAEAPLPDSGEMLSLGNKAKAPFPSTGNGTSVPYGDKKSEAKVSLPDVENKIGCGTLVPQIRKKYTHLPHVDIKGYYQFITFRTYDSLDDYLKKLYNLDKPNRQKQQYIDNYLDNSKNGAYLNGKILKYLYDFFRKNDKKLYELIAFCIMPNHIHLLFKPLDGLSIVMQKIKGITAKEINAMLGRKSKFWANDYYDRAIRDEKHFLTVYEYIKNNPLKICGAEAPLPNTGAGTLVPYRNKQKSEAEASLPDVIDSTLVSTTRFYGIYDE